MRGQDEPKLMLWLATWAGKMELSCLLRIQTLSLKENLFTFWCFIPYNKSFIDQACSVKMAAYWLHSFFCMFMDLDFISVHKHTKKQLGQYPAWLHTWSITHNYILYYKLKQVSVSTNWNKLKRNLVSHSLQNLKVYTCNYLFLKNSPSYPSKFNLQNQRLRRWPTGKMSKYPLFCKSSWPSVFLSERESCRNKFAVKDTSDLLAAAVSCDSLCGSLWARSPYKMTASSSV